MVSIRSYPTTVSGSTLIKAHRSEDGVTATLRLVAYSELYLKESWKWLRDPEIKALTMTPDFDREGQRRFFDSLAERIDYRIWGVELPGFGPIGAAGLKHIDRNRAEYWGYIGEKTQWGLGLGKQMLSAIEERARALGIEQLYLNVAPDNFRAVSLYRRAGYVAGGGSAETLMMTKSIDDAQRRA